MVRRIMTVKKKWRKNKCSKRRKTLKSKNNKVNKINKKLKNKKSLSKNKNGGGWGRSMSRPIIIDINQNGGWGEKTPVVLKRPKVSNIKKYFTKHF